MKLEFSKHGKVWCLASW